jgi:hypothetical protein
MDFADAGLSLNDTNTAAQACGGTAGNRPLSVRNTLLFNNGPGGTLQAAGAGNGGTCTGANWYNNILAPEYADLPATNNVAGPSPGIVTGAYPTAITTQFIPPAGANVSAPDCKPIEPDFFDTAAYKGAFLPAERLRTTGSAPAPAIRSASG